jgi:hypothetical protein
MVCMTHRRRGLDSNFRYAGHAGPTAAQGAGSGTDGSQTLLLYEDGFYTPSYSCETSLFVWSVSIDTAIRPITPQPRM